MRRPHIKQHHWFTVMITQIKSKRNSLRQRSLTLEIHPDLQARLQMSRMNDSKYTHKFTSISSPGKEDGEHQTSIPEENYNSVDAVSHHLQSKRGMQLQRKRREEKREMKLSSYQLYKQEQKFFKETHSVRINEWKSKYMSLKNERDKSTRISKINRTNSLSLSRSINSKEIVLPIPITAIKDIAPFRSQLQSKFRSTFIKTSEGKRKITDSSAYMRKLKTKIQFYSLSTIITDRENFFKHLSPQINSIQPQPFKDAKKECERNRELQGAKLRVSIKPAKAKYKLRGPKKEVSLCRPWSGFKEDVTNELITYI